MLVAVLVLLALAGAVLLCRRGTLLWPVVLIVLCGLWLLVDKPLEGPVLVGISRGHGITLSDLLAPAGLAFAAVLLYRRGSRTAPARTENASQPTQNAQPTENSP